MSVIPAMAVHTVSAEQDYFVHTINNIEDTHIITVLLPDTIDFINETVNIFCIYLQRAQKSETTNAENTCF